MIRLFRFLFGYVEFSFKGGFCEGFINDCFKASLDVKNIIRTDDGILAIASVKTYKKLHHIAYKNGGKVAVIRRRGLPFFIAPLKGRWGFFTGTVAFILIVSLMTSLVWNVEITGNERISEAQLDTCLEAGGLSIGVFWSSFDRKTLAYSLMADFEDIGWAHINKIGTTARLEINESTIPPVQKTEKEKGDLGIARKEIILTVSRVQSESEKIDENTYTSLYFFGLTIPLYLQKEKGVSGQKAHYVEIKNVELPIAIICDTEKYYSKHDIILSDDQLVTLAKERLEQEKNEKFADCQIINQTINTKLDENSCVITGSYIVKYD